MKAALLIFAVSSGPALALSCADVGYVTSYKHIETRVTTYRVDEKCENFLYEERWDGELHDSGSYPIKEEWNCSHYSSSTGKCENRSRRFWNSDRTKLHFEQESFDDLEFLGVKGEEEIRINDSLERVKNEIVRRSVENRRWRNDRTRWEWLESRKTGIEFFDATNSRNGDRL